MDHTLGALHFAKALNRTIVLPPFNVYLRGTQMSFPTFASFFDVPTVQEYHRAIPMDTFMRLFGDKQWAPAHRRGYCWSADGEKPLSTCDIKNGSPFGPFWDNFKIDFSSYYGMRMSFDVHNQGILAAWKYKFPVDQHPVIAMKGAPASYPIHELDRPLQKCVRMRSCRRVPWLTFRGALAWGAGTLSGRTS
jgi:peptide-O-fucosyltransferase